jgi:hypothetical protein
VNDAATTTLITEALKLGILGPILVACAWFVRHLQAELKEANRERAEDAKKAQEALVEAEKRRALDAQEMLTRFLVATEKWQQVFAENAKHTEGVLASEEKTQSAVRDVEEVLQDLVTSNTELRTVIKERR